MTCPHGTMISEEEFFQQFSEFSEQAACKGNRLPVSRGEIHAILHERTPTTGFDAHYVYHMGWAAEVLADLKPALHVDIGSHNHFAVILAAFVPVVFYDYRPMGLRGLRGYRSGFADLNGLPFPSQSISSLSCMHVLEHVGLGRYGDDLDYDGDLAAASELERVLAPGGDLLIVTPVGRPRVVFNAHRVYSVEQVRAMFAPLSLKEFSLVPDNYAQTGLIRNCGLSYADRQEYGCGCFRFGRSLHT